MRNTKSAFVEVTQTNMAVEISVAFLVQVPDLVEPNPKEEVDISSGLL